MTTNIWIVFRQKDNREPVVHSLHTTQALADAAAAKVAGWDGSHWWNVTVREMPLNGERCGHACNGTVVDLTCSFCRSY